MGSPQVNGCRVGKSMNIIYWLAVDLSQLGVLFPIYGENNIPLVSHILLIYGLYIYGYYMVNDG